ncbi:putative serine/threonine protein kinase [Nocardia nova SH22a]|uniref:non-specific serine/threonine protein kinase n=1 Tax=Nocardia nova SH22a TaxID=1415166 RepID=W5TN12_9NOCA|nr:serine/threonine-protein kinase [Nocardia nova]AHH20509.1 putative serine/threonine protein kinase [Nocardia nova SH22a]
MLNNGDVFAGFIVERLLGQGGMGSVYLARHPRLPRLTALKLLNRELYTDAEIRARFEREADLCAQLDHPGIVAVYDRGVEDDQLWICMQYVDGIDAAGVNPLSLPIERAVQIIEGVASALDYAHENGVMHRDVKPANILLARAVDGKGERVFLTDFGIARLREDSTHLTQAGMFTATLAYASPEQMTGAELDHRSDQYSLACALYWMLTGIGPFDSEHPTEVIRGHLQLPVPPASARRAGLSPAMDAVISRAMAKRPAERFRNCVEFASAARKALSAPVGPATVIGAAPTVIAGGGPHTMGPGVPAPTAAPGGHRTFPAPGPAMAAAGLGTPAMRPTGPTGAQMPGAPAAMVPNPPTSALPPAGASLPVPSRYPGPPAPPVGYGAALGYPQPRRRSGGAIAAAIVAAIVLVAIVVTVVVVVSHQKTTNNADEMKSAFSHLAGKANSSSGSGYGRQSCFREDDGTTLRAPGSNATDLKMGSWKLAWDCKSTQDVPDYAVVAYNSRSDVQKVIAGLPDNTKGVGVSDDGVGYNSYLWKLPDSTLRDEYWKVIAFRDGTRSRFLIIAHEERWADLDRGMTYQEFDTWCNKLPMT